MFVVRLEVALKFLLRKYIHTRRTVSAEEHNIMHHSICKTKDNYYRQTQSMAFCSIHEPDNADVDAVKA